jgi:uncharacterized membrane protein YfcA
MLLRLIHFGSLLKCDFNCKMRSYTKVMKGASGANGGVKGSGGGGGGGIPGVLAGALLRRVSDDVPRVAAAAASLPGQGLTLVHYLAQRNHILWDTLGA